MDDQTDPRRRIDGEWEISFLTNLYRTAAGAAVRFLFEYKANGPLFYCEIVLLSSFLYKDYANIVLILIFSYKDIFRLIFTPKQSFSADFHIGTIFA